MTDTRRPPPDPWDGEEIEALKPVAHLRAKAAGLLLFTPVAAFLLPSDRAMAFQVGLYGLTLGAMAACAWASSFPRYRVGAGAAIFVVSDLLIFAGMGPLAASDIPHIFVWPCYYLAQFLICTGVLQTLRRQGARSSTRSA